MIHRRRGDNLYGDQWSYTVIVFKIFCLLLRQLHTFSHMHVKPFISISLVVCRTCECDPSGSVGDCSPLDGRCHCKDNVEGQSCGRWGLLFMSHICTHTNLYKQAIKNNFTWPVVTKATVFVVSCTKEQLNPWWTINQFVVLYGQVFIFKSNILDWNIISLRFSRNVKSSHKSAHPTSATEC